MQLVSPYAATSRAIAGTIVSLTGHMATLSRKPASKYESLAARCPRPGQNHSVETMDGFGPAEAVRARMRAVVDATPCDSPDRHS